MAHGVGLYRPIQDINDIVVISLTFVVCKSDKTNVSEAIREAPALRTPNCIRKMYTTFRAAPCRIKTNNTIRYDNDSVYLTCSRKLTGSQLSLPHGINQILKCETENKLMSVIGPVQSHYHEGSPVGKRSLRWEGFVEKVGFEHGVIE